MAIALQEAPTPQQQTTINPSQAFTANVAAGDVLIFAIDWGALTGSVNQVADTTDSILWSQVDTFSSQTRSLAVFAKVVRTAGSCTVTATLDSSRSVTFSMYRFSGLTLNLDGTPKHNSGAATTSPLTATLSTTFAADLVLALLRGGAISVSPSTPWNSESTGGHGTTYQIRSSTGSLGTTWTTSSSAFITTILALRAGFNINAAGLASTEADGTPKISTAINLIGLDSNEADGTPAVTAGPVSIQLIGLVSSEADGTPKVSTAINLIGLASTEADGTPKVSQSINLIGLGSAEVDGTPKVSTTINLIGLPSTEKDGTPKVSTVINLIELPSGELDGTPKVSVSINLVGLGSTLAIGQPSVSTKATIILTALGSVEQDGTPNITLVPYPVQLIGLPSTEHDGTPSVTLSPVNINLVGLASAEHDGVPSITLSPYPIQLIGVASTEQDGIPSVSISHPFIQLIGLPSQERDGIPSVHLCIKVSLVVVDVTVVNLLPIIKPYRVPPQFNTGISSESSSPIILPSGSPEPYFNTR